MGDRVSILMYHRLGEIRTDSIVPAHYVDERLFERHLKLLRAIRMNVLSLAEMTAGFAGEAALPKRPAVITFDDGYESFSRRGLPILERYGMRATVFLVSDLVGGRNEWDLAKGDVEEALMDRDAIHSAMARGAEMGAHTCRHVDLTSVPLAVAEREIRDSKADLESWLGRSVDFFCYPYGAQNAEVRELVRKAGYRGATGTRLFGNDESSDPFQWGRINARANTTPFRLLRRLLKTSRAPR